MAKELVLIPKADYDKLLSQNVNMCNHLRNTSSTENACHTSDNPTPLNANGSAGDVNKHISKSFTFNNDKVNLNNTPTPENSKEISSLSKSSSRIDDRDKVNSDGEIKKMKSVSAKLNGITSIRSKSNDDHLERDQFGGQTKGRKYVKQTFSEFLENKRRPRWIPYKR